VAELFGATPGDASLQERPYGRGRAIFTGDERSGLLRALAAQAPDVKFSEAREHVAFVHRRVADRDYYFLANTSVEPQKLEASFRVGKKQPEVWDLRSGRMEVIEEFEQDEAGTRVRFELGPLESRAMLFRPGVRRVRGTAKASGDVPAAVTLTPRWRLRFDDASIARVDLEQLKSWTEIPAARFFSGRGIYEAEFEAPSGFERWGLWLDLGSVRETADVRINERPAGVAWMRPYRVEITGLIRRGTNRLRVDVTNLLINKVLGMGPIDYSAVYAKYGQRFPPGDEWKVVREPLISGLLGPVRVVYGERQQG
jgi:hypothetical protein